jgi:hypothetical protein
MDRKYLTEWRKFLMEVNPEDPEAQPEEEEKAMDFGEVGQRPGEWMQRGSDKISTDQESVPKPTNTPKKTPQGKKLVEDGKADLVDELQKYLSAMETNNQYSALGVAQVMYNACADWMNKQNKFANRPGNALTTKAAAAPTK